MKDRCSIRIHDHSDQPQFVQLRFQYPLRIARRLVPKTEPLSRSFVVTFVEFGHFSKKRKRQRQRFKTKLLGQPLARACRKSRQSAELHSALEFGPFGCAQNRDAEGVSHISPGQRPGKRVVGVNRRPKACLINASWSQLYTRISNSRLDIVPIQLASSGRIFVSFVPFCKKGRCAAWTFMPSEEFCLTPASPRRTSAGLRSAEGCVTWD